MKKIIFIIILGVFTLLNAQHIANISNVNYHSRVLDYSNYSGSINKYQNRLYVESEGMIEEFEINTNGALDRISFYEKKGIGINTAFVSGDSLYFFDQDEDSYLINVFNMKRVSICQHCCCNSGTCRKFFIRIRIIENCSP